MSYMHTARERWEAGIPTSRRSLRNKSLHPWYPDVSYAESRRRAARRRRAETCVGGCRRAAGRRHAVFLTAHASWIGRVDGSAVSGKPNEVAAILLLPDAQCAGQQTALGRGASREPQAPSDPKLCHLGLKRVVAHHVAAPAGPSGRPLIRRRNSRARSC
jgi:hypothetical protein